MLDNPKFLANYKSSISMAQGDTGKKAMPQAENREIAAKDAQDIRRQADEFNSWLARMEAMDSQELKQYKEQNKDTFNSQKKDAIKKIQQKEKKKRKRTVLSPILGAVMKFHRDDDMDPSAAGPAL
uniref:Uncharacterized protein n=1 Tax=Oryza brachyantha TaxID=4533 RepID=J3MVM8_ORYBR